MLDDPLLADDNSDEQNKLPALDVVVPSTEEVPVGDTVAEIADRVTIQDLYTQFLANAADDQFITLEQKRDLVDYNEVDVYNNSYFIDLGAVEDDNTAASAQMLPPPLP